MQLGNHPAEANQTTMPPQCHREETEIETAEDRRTIWPRASVSLLLAPIPVDGPAVLSHVAVDATVRYRRHMVYTIELHLWQEMPPAAAWVSVVSAVGLAQHAHSHHKRHKTANVVVLTEQTRRRCSPLLEMRAAE